MFSRKDSIIDKACLPSGDLSQHARTETFFYTVSSAGSLRANNIFFHMKFDPGRGSICEEVDAQLCCVKQDYLGLLRLRTLTP